MYALADARLIPGGEPYGIAWFDNIALPAAGISEFTSDIHPAGRNIVFCDGQVEAIRRAKLFEKSDDWARHWYADEQPHPELWAYFPDK